MLQAGREGRRSFRLGNLDETPVDPGFHAIKPTLRRRQFSADGGNGSGGERVRKRRRNGGRFEDRELALLPLLLLLYVARLLVPDRRGRRCVHARVRQSRIDQGQLAEERDPIRRGEVKHGHAVLQQVEQLVDVEAVKLGVAVALEDDLVSLDATEIVVWFFDGDRATGRDCARGRSRTVVRNGDGLVEWPLIRDWREYRDL